MRGRLLVASPTLRDPNFDRTVILLIEHSDEGALGVVLNRPSELAVDEVLPQWSERAQDPPVMFIGGPVQPNAVICLARTEREVEGLLVPTAIGGIGLVDLDGDPIDAGPDLTLRCFAGYAGWDGGQLEGELAEQAWFVVDVEREDPFATEPDQLWRRVLARQPGNLSRYALYPADPSLN
jgi:putative transcriptional regulator